MDRETTVTVGFVALAVAAWLLAAQYTSDDLVLWALLFGIGLGGPAAYRFWRGRASP